MSTPTPGAYGLGRTTSLPYAEAVAATRAALKDVGFGVLWEIDVPATMAAKLGVTDLAPYLILGACNPHLANRALRAEPDLGLLLPCNVVVYVQADGRTAVKAIDPAKMMAFTGNPDLAPIAAEAGEALSAALAKLPR